MDEPLVVFFYTPWKHQGTFGFQGVYEETSGMEWVNEIWHELSELSISYSFLATK